MTPHSRPVAPILSLAALGVAAVLAVPAGAETSPAHWPQWRGPDGTGAAPGSDPPLTWSDRSNVRYKVEVPGRGLASPVIWGDRIYLLTAVEVPPETAAGEPEAAGEGETASPGAASAPPPGRRRRGVSPDRELRFVVLALDRAGGEVVWERTAIQARPHEGTHTDGSWAAASAVTDGERIWASFGSRGIFCYSRDGKLLWQKQLGQMRTRNAFGEGASPALGDGILVVNWDHEDDSFVVALDALTGEERWRQERDEPTSWSTPLIVEVAGKKQVVVSATGRVRGYDLATGAVVWEAGGMTLNTVPSPVSADGLVYVSSGFRGNALRAIRLAGAQGDVTDTEAVVWSYDKDTPYVPSPLLYRGVLYFLKHNQGILTALDAATGEAHYGPVRLEEIDGVYASPVGAAGRVYVAGRNGVTMVLEAGSEMKVLAVNRLDDRFDASPAVAEDEIYLRGRQPPLRPGGERRVVRRRAVGRPAGTPRPR